VIYGVTHWCKFFLVFFPDVSFLQTLTYSSAKRCCSTLQYQITYWLTVLSGLVKNHGLKTYFGYKPVLPQLFCSMHPLHHTSEYHYPLSKVVWLKRCIQILKSLSVLLIVASKCVLATLHAAPWWVTVSMPTGQTDR